NLFAEVLMVSTKNKSNNEWVLDTGCSYHMCPNRSWFRDLTESKQGVVTLGDDYECDIEGIGNIPLRLQNGRTILLTKVRFIPEL
ncbi:hypothetical protein PSY31_23395, partial [Shigella flexneri]|nr:hypothetical protein [Shigella flexneri]